MLLNYPDRDLLEIFDPQNVFAERNIIMPATYGTVGNESGNKTYFSKFKQGIAEWWQPMDISIFVDGTGNSLRSDVFPLPLNERFVKIDLKSFFNEKVTNIFKQQYLSPRPTSPTLQLPTQGIGNWAYPLTEATINDSGLRKNARDSNEIQTPTGIPFATPADTSLKNILFVSQWDNFPDSVAIPISGYASRAHLLMAGSTNPMQSRLINGMIVAKYKDGTADTMLLENPTNWWPIEQDYYVDGLAFTASKGEMPERLYLKEGKFARGISNYTTIRGFSNRAIDGGAATVLDMNLDGKKQLATVTVYAIANDVVVGLMSLTLEKTR